MNKEGWISSLNSSFEMGLQRASCRNKLNFLEKITFYVQESWWHLLLIVPHSLHACLNSKVFEQGRELQTRSSVIKELDYVCQVDCGVVLVANAFLLHFSWERNKKRFATKFIIVASDQEQECNTQTGSKIFLTSHLIFFRRVHEKTFKCSGYERNQKIPWNCLRLKSEFIKTLTLMWSRVVAPPRHTQHTYIDTSVVGS